MKPSVRLLACAVTLLPVPVMAQGYIRQVPPRTTERVYLVIDVGAMPSTQDFRSTGPVRTEFGPGTVKTSGETQATAGGAFGGGVMFSRRFGLGLTMSRVEHPDVPMLWTISLPRRNGTIATGYYWAGTQRKEEGYHVEASYVLHRGRSGAVRAFGGPTLFRLKQLAEYNPTYADFGDRDGEIVYLKRETKDVRGTGWGYHAGLDASIYAVQRGAFRFGMGGTVRYASGSVDMENPLDKLGSTDSYGVGGWQLLGGFRFGF